jgi:glycosyltransferase involved in cell wall biosynthesis
MRIGINARFLLSKKMEGFGVYSHELLSRLVLMYPQHTFVFYFDRKPDPKFMYNTNVIPKVLFPPARHPYLWIWWFESSLTNALIRDKVDVFWSLDGHASLRTNIPQIVTIHDLNFEHRPIDLPKRVLWYYKKYFPLFANKAKHIITVSEFSKTDIENTYGISKNKISVVWNGASTLFKPLEEDMKKNVREEFANGKSYFLFVGSIHPRKNLNGLLKAFQLFVEENESHDLVVVGSHMWDKIQSNELVDKIKSRVHFLGHVPAESLCKITASAHCTIMLSHFEGFGIPVVEAMKCGVPSIGSNSTSIPEVIGDSGILVNQSKPVEIASEMLKTINNAEMYLNLRNQSIARAQLFDWDQAAESIGKILNL